MSRPLRPLSLGMKRKIYHSDTEDTEKQKNFGVPVFRGKKGSITASIIASIIKSRPPTDACEAIDIESTIIARMGQYRHGIELRP